jgi:hypothetical protein
VGEGTTDGMSEAGRRDDEADAGQDPPGPPEPEPIRSGLFHRIRFRWEWLRTFAGWWSPQRFGGAVAVGLLAGLGVNFIPQWVDGSHPGPTPQAGPDGSPDTCHYFVTDHRLYAGFSTTMADETDIAGGSNNDVRELQCLLLRMDISPGPVDGSFGAGTQRAVEEAQRRGHVTPDGRVGPKTWKVLRAVK